MASITDTLLLGPEQFTFFCSQYPTCRFASLVTNSSKAQQYLISVAIDDEDRYYDFLLDNSLSVFSTSFLIKLKKDQIFASKIRKRIEGN